MVAELRKVQRSQPKHPYSAYDSIPAEKSAAESVTAKARTAAALKATEAIQAAAPRCKGRSGLYCFADGSENRRQETRGSCSVQGQLAQTLHQPLDIGRLIRRRDSFDNVDSLWRFCEYLTAATCCEVYRESSFWAFGEIK